MRLWLLLALAHVALAALAQTPAPEPSPEEKYRDYTPSEIAELPEEVRLNEVPVRYIFAAQGYEDPLGFELAHSMKLQALMYPAAVSFVDAVEAFQHDLGEAETGTLTVAQIAELTYRNGVVKLGRAELPNTVRVVTLYDEYATAQGSWTGTQTPVDWPINQVHIECNREQAFCEESVTSVVVPTRESWDMDFLILSSTDRYAVTRWRRQEIEATRLLNCRHVNLTLRRDGEVERLPGDPASIEENCQASALPGDSAAELPQAVRLVDGVEIVRERYRQLQRQAISFMSSDFRARLDAWRSSAPVTPAEAEPPASEVE